MKNKKLLKKLTETAAPSGREHWLYPFLLEAFKPFGDVSLDALNSVYVEKKGSEKSKIMLMAHSDEIFLMVKEICKNGFLKFIGAGIDPKTLVSQEVTIHGKKDFLGIIGIKPPHLMSEEDKKKGVSIDSLFIDTGFDKEILESMVQIGDYVTLKRDLIELCNDNVACKAADNRAGVTAMYACAKELQKVSHDLNVHFVASSQEEVGSRGAKASCYRVKPQLAIAIDTTFDNGPLGDSERENTLGKGPVICIGPNIHPKFREYSMTLGSEHGIPFQVEVEPGNTGTDAWHIQTAGSGIPTLLISIPVKYMHTSVEIVNMEDIKNTGKLIAKFIEVFKEKDMGELLCF